MVREQSANIKSALSVLTLCLLFGVAGAAKGDWKSEANARIEQIRKRNAQIIIVDSNSQPVPGVSVEINQVERRFAFGSAIRLYNVYSDPNYTNFFKNHFEWAVCEGEAKWPYIEQERDVEWYGGADYIYDWCASNNITMRGHCLFWEQDTQVQDWVKALPYAAYPTPSELLTEVDEHIVSAVSHFTGKYRHWDVDNEMIPNHFYDRLGDLGRVHMFQLANEVDPCCMLFMNEYTGNSFGGYDANSYIARANGLRALGAPVQGIGIQCHMSADSVFDPQKFYNDILQQLTTYIGLPILVTEYDTPHWDVNQRADNLENFFRVCFSHPSVEGILMWGFWENAHWKPNAYIVDANWVLNEAGIRYESLMNEWKTNEVNTTYLAGDVNFRGFHGAYEITLSSPGQSIEIHMIELEPGEAVQQFQIDTNIVPQQDLTSPTPDPPVWTAVPAATSPTTITMTVAACDDTSRPVRYYFECVNDSNADSGWQTSPTYTAAGLSPGTQYTFRVKARDSAPFPNETAFSNEQSATTFPAPVNIAGSWLEGTTHTREPGNNRLLLFTAHAEDNEDPSIAVNSVSYGGQPMTKIIEWVVGYTVNSRAYVTVFMLDEQGISAADGNTLDISWNQPPDSAAYSSVFLADVNQAAPVGVTSGNGSTLGSTIATSELVTCDGDMAILAATCTGTGTYTVNNGFINAGELTLSGADGVVGYKTATGVPETPSVTHSSSNHRQVLTGLVIKAAGDIPPAAPANLTATEGDGVITLDWGDNAEGDFAGYNVYRSTTSGSGYEMLNVSLITDSNYIDADVVEDITYYYVVTAVDTAGIESGYSNEASATPGYQTCPEVIAGGFGFYSDLNGDCYIEWFDLAVITNHWLFDDCNEANNYCDSADLDTSGYVDFADFSDIGYDWRLCNNPGDANCTPNW